MNHPDFSLRQLAYFVAVADAGTLSGAATRLHVSQPGLSLALTNLERSLGAQLLVRRKAHGITLTPAGRHVLRSVRDLLRRAEELEIVASGGDPIAGTLSVGCYVTIAPTALPPLLQGFASRHPGVRVDLTEGTQDVLQSALLAGELDLVIAYDMDLRPELARTRFASVRPHILLPAGHHLAGRPTVALADVAEEPQILLDAPPSSSNTIAIFERFGVIPNVRYRTATLELTRALVGRGLGWALLTQRPANDRTYEGHRVVIKEIAEPVPDARIVLTWPKEFGLNRRAQAFVDYCRARAAGGLTGP